MAKVYDALRRAEAERRRRAGQDSAVGGPLEWEPEKASAPVAPIAPVERGSFWSRLLSWRRAAVETTGDLNKRRISLLQPDSFVAEQFRALRGRIDAIAADRPLRTIAVTSATPGEGKTTSAINLAIVTSLSVGRRVLLVDCDLRRPKVHSALGISPEAGLAEVLTDQIGLEQAIVKPEGMGLEILAVRGRPANPSELLGSARMRELIEEVAARYDRVILDTPAALGLPDAKAVADLSDGIVVVVRADVSRQEDIQTVLEIIDRRRVLGLVLNGAVADQGRYGYVS
ncbi:MAG TPA: CpsD/CapB family tyrosine-protein kinase [Myxococcota bacterium]|nr:CpsD/CapB family tyrosine-protein kinase [Myxococcota bacterium]